jgi:hypothetical protein
MSQDATGVLIIRAWLEDASSVPLRAHVSITTDVSQGIQREQNFVDVEAVCAVVEEWLTGISVR